MSSCVFKGSVKWFLSAPPPSAAFIMNASPSLYSFSSGHVASLSFLAFLSCSSRSDDLLSLFSSLVYISWSYTSQSGFACFIIGISSSLQSASLLPCARGWGETAAASLGESHWAGGLMWCLGLSASSIILYYFQDSAAVLLSSVAHPLRAGPVAIILC